MTKSWIITDIYRAGTWSLKASKAEEFASFDAAFARSAERHNRYPVAR